MQAAPQTPRSRHSQGPERCTPSSVEKTLCKFIRILHKSAILHGGTSRQPHHDCSTAAQPVTPASSSRQSCCQCCAARPEGHQELQRQSVAGSFTSPAAPCVALRGKAWRALPGAWMLACCVTSCGGGSTACPCSPRPWTPCGVVLAQKSGAC